MNNEADFFVAGGTLRTSAPSYVIRPADAELLQHLQAGEFCYVLTPRQMGKSSLMVRTAQRLRTEDVRVAIIDLTSIGASSSAISADQWYLGLLSRIRSELRLATEVQAWWQAHSAFSVAQRFTDFLQQVVLTECADKVVILIDEIDSTLMLPFRDDFFAAIRAIYNERAHNPIYSRLTFALFGVATPTDLIQDRERTPFNIGHRIDLREFTLADAEPLRQGLAHQLPEQADAIFQRIFYWTNGHPYLTQKLCQAVVLHTTDWQEENVEQGVDQLVNTAFLSEEGRKDPNLTFVQDRIVTSPEREQRQMLCLYRRVRYGERVADDNRSLIQNRLELYGLVGVTQSMLQVRNRIYEQVFTSAWIDSMMPVNRQQRIAMIASALALVLLIGVIAILNLTPNPTCDELSTIFIENANDSNTRLGVLASLLQQGNVCRGTVFDLFYSINAQEQLALFDGLRDLPNERNRLNNVISNIYLTLDTEPAHDQALMERWLSSLRNAGLTEENTLVSSINYWRIGREAFQQGNFQKAITAYESAIDTLEDGNHLVLHYDLALAFIKTSEYTKAIAELDEIVSIAPLLFAPYTPTPEITSTPIVSPLESPATKLSINAPALDSVSAITATPIIASVSPLTTVEMKTVTSAVVLSPTVDVVLVQSYQQRFRTTESVYAIVKQTVEENLQLTNHLRTHIDRHLELADLFDFSSNPLAIKGLSVFSDSPTIAGNPTSFVAVIVQGIDVTYSWDFGDGSPLVYGTAAPRHIYTLPGDYVVTVQARNETSFATASHTVQIIETSLLSGLRITGPNAGQINIPTIFTATVESGTNTRFEWVLSDGTIWIDPTTGPLGRTSTYTHIFRDAKQYTITVFANNNGGRISNSTTITIQDVLPIILNIISLPSTRLVEFTAYVVSHSNVEGEWFWGDGSSTSTVPENATANLLTKKFRTSHLYATEGKYVVTFVVRNISGTDSTDIIVHAQDNQSSMEPSVPIRYEPSLLKAGQPITYSVPLDKQQYTCIWDLGDRILMDSSTTVLHIYKQPKAYIVSVQCDHLTGSPKHYGEQIMYIGDK